MTTTREIRLKSRPVGMPTHDNFDLLADGVQLGSGPGGLPAAIFASNFDAGSLAGWSVFD